MDTTTLGILILIACVGVAGAPRKGFKLMSLAIAVGLGIVGIGGSLS